MENRQRPVEEWRELGQLINAVQFGESLRNVGVPAEYGPVFELHTRAIEDAERAAERIRAILDARYGPMRGGQR